MTDTKPTHIPGEGEATPALPGDTDLAKPAEPGGTSATEDDRKELPPFDPQMGVAMEQG